MALALHSSAAQACGGFFCGQQPVDQTAERILFEVGEDSVTMTTQISFSGAAEDFAWVIPLSAVPDVESLAVSSQSALSALDINSGPVFNAPTDPECLLELPGLERAVSVNTDNSVDESEQDGVQVLIQTEVGEYSVAVIESDDPEALVQWLRDNQYRITDAMLPYIKLYTDEGLKFMALRLLDTADVNNLKPFRFTLPGTTPNIPLRMTALAAEPEMSVIAFVLSDQRYEAKNWANLEIEDDQIRYNPFSYSFPIATNWAKLVAQSVDEAGGQGWVTEFAGSSAPYAEQVRAQVQRSNFRSEEDEAGARDLLAAFERHPYLTRLYTRLSAEEMTSDPVFGRSALDDVSREHQLSRFVNGLDQCSEDFRISVDPCDYNTCGAGGLCRSVGGDENGVGAVAACACIPGATARPMLAVDGSATVICQDGRLSFMNPGDRQGADGEVLSDPCAEFSCGDNGSCIAMNMRPTCVCDQGFVAKGEFDDAGLRQTRCVQPDEAIPGDFYQKRLAALPTALPGGRVIEVVAPETMDPDATRIDSTGAFPMPRVTDETVLGPDANEGSRSNSDSGWCSLGVSAPSYRSGAAGWGLIALLAAVGLRRRRRQ